MPATRRSTADPVQGERLIRALSLPNVLPLVALDFILLALLIWPKAQELGRWFVPLTLALGLIPLLVGYYLWPAINPLQSPFVMFFFVTAVLVAWEYKYRYLYVYVFAITLYQTLVSPWYGNVPWTVPGGFLVLQAVMMLLVGSVVATMVTVQAAQRAELADAYWRQAADNERLQQYAATLEELSITRERNRLSRELHDTLAHSLSAVTVQIEAVRSLWDKQPQKAHDMLEKADATARTGLAEARHARCRRYARRRWKTSASPWRSRSSPRARPTAAGPASSCACPTPCKAAIRTASNRASTVSLRKPSKTPCATRPRRRSGWNCARRRTN